MVMNKTEIAHIYEGFRSCTLPKERWTHEAHLISALSLLNDYGLVEAESIMPDMIRDYNTSRGGINSATEGYHHTITIFYLRMIEKFRIEHSGDDVVTQIAKLLRCEIAEPYFTLNFYSKEHLFTPAARLGFVHPDKQAY